MIKNCRNYQAITIAVSQLLILDWKIQDEHNEYTLQAPTQHPFITILNQAKLSWRSVVNQMKLIMHHYDKQYVLYTHTHTHRVFLYNFFILCI